MERFLDFGLVAGDFIHRPQGGNGLLPQLHPGVGAVGLQGGENGVVHGGKNLALIAELHLSLGWVDIHIHRVELCLQVEDTAGETPYHSLIFVGLLQGGHHEF